MVVARIPSTPFRRQLGRVRRRLFLQRLLDVVVWASVAALSLIGIWLLVEPFAARQGPAWLRLAVCSGVAAVAVVLSGVVAWRTRPAAISAALALDAHF